MRKSIISIIVISRSMASRKTSAIIITMFLVLSSSAAVAMTAVGGGDNLDAEIGDYDNSWIKISSPEDLSKIGSTGAEGTYPSDGKYVLTKDIDFTGKDLNGGFDISIGISYSGSVVKIVLFEKSNDKVLVAGTSGINITVNGSTESYSATGTTFTISPSPSEIEAEVVVTGDALISDENVPFTVITTFKIGEGGSEIRNISTNGNMDPLTSSTPYFSGTFHGNGHKIIGLNTAVYKTKGIAHAGLFAETDEGATFDGIWLEGGSAVAISSLSASYACAGGLVGFGSSTIMNSYNTGDVTATASSQSYVGGLVGASSSTVTIVITNSYNTGDVTASISTSQSYAGGLVGYGYAITMTNSYNTGDVTATASSASSQSFAGGLLAEGNSTITNCYNIGDVTATTSIYAYVGGLVGDSPSTITNSYNIGSVVATGATVYKGSIIGAAGATSYITNCYFLDSPSLTLVGSGTAIVDGGFTRESNPSGGLSMVNLQNKGSYFIGDAVVNGTIVKGWDFQNTWYIDNSSNSDLSKRFNNGLPYLNVFATIFIQPKDVTSDSVSGNVFAVELNISVTAEYQWLRSTDNGETWKPISNANTSSYTTGPNDDFGYLFKCNIVLSSDKILVSDSAALKHSVSSGGDNTMLYIGIAAVIAVAALIAVYFMFLRKS